MHIVLANQWFPPESGWGGVAMWNYAMAHAYSQLGHQVTVVASRPSEKVSAVRDVNGIVVRRILIRDVYRLRRLPLVGRYVRPLQQLWYSYQVAHTLHAVHERQPIEVIEFADVNAEGLFYTRPTKTTVVVRCHTPTRVLNQGCLAGEVPYSTKLTELCEQRFIQRAKHLTAPSADMARVIAQEYHVAPTKIQVLPNALAAEAFVSSPRERHDQDLMILYVGRLERVKGIDVLARAILQVAPQLPQVRFVLAGADRPTRERLSVRQLLEKEFEAARLSERIQILGSISHEHMLELYRRADICVVPSLAYESFSYTCAQAMAAGVPVIASRVGGIPETVGEDGGLIVEPGNSQALAEAIMKLARDRVLRQQFGAKGYQRARRNYLASEIAPQMLEYFQYAKDAQSR